MGRVWLPFILGREGIGRKRARILRVGRVLIPVT